ncbi:MAG: TolC family protein [Clostridiales Family XIII bacterium]|jgi:hypothetical protein|nr:TolC family protein [Clostridiales Family XIII bacterium]
MKKGLSRLLGFALSITLATVGAAAYAADADASEISPGMDFVGDAISLSLDKAVERMTTTGPGFESAALAKEAFEAQAKGQEDLWSSWRGVSRSISPGDLTPDPTKSLNAKVVRMTRPYLISQAAIQYEIDLNTLVYDTTQIYHQALQAEEALRIARENLQTQQDILSNTNKKFELGVVSKMEVLSAESAVQDADVKVGAAESALKAAKMSFNQKLYYPLMQDVKLTDPLARADAPTVELKAAIESALANRNELNQLQYALDKASLELADKNLVSRFSAEYLTAALAVKQAEKGLKDAKQLIELDIRVKYMGIQNLDREIASMEKNVSNAKEGYRLADLSYNAGMNTLVDVQNAQLASYQTQLGLSAKILEYNLAVSDLSLAMGYGRSAASAGQQR